MQLSESTPPRGSDYRRRQHLDALEEWEVASSCESLLLVVLTYRWSFAQVGSSVIVTAVVVALRLPLGVAPALVEAMTIVGVVIADFGQLRPLGTFWE